MRKLRHHVVIRTAIVALLMVSWLAFTNHCALGMMQPTVPAAKKSGHCCGGQADPKHEQPDTLRTCCNIKATTAPAKAGVKFDGAKFVLQIFALDQMFSAAQTEPRCVVSVFDHGPPRSISFAESVLQRSLLSHAPPFAV